jgi:hypothetical protein
MLSEFKRKTNIGVGLALFVQVVGKLMQNTEIPALVVLGAIVALLGFGLFIWGCTQYARGKGWSPYYGALGLLWLLGLIVLALLPDRHRAIQDGLGEIMVCAADGNLERLRELVEFGGDVNARSISGTTALMYAARNNHLAIVEFLLAAGADPELKSDKGSTAADIARKFGYLEIAARLKQHGTR